MDKRLYALIVDDSEDDTLLVARELRRAGYELEYERVDTPAGMMEALEKKEWEVIIVDYKMPHFSGIDALRIAREKNPDVPFILVSGVIVEEMAVEAMRRGANDCIKKENLERLTPTIARELQSARERRERKIAQNLLSRKNNELLVANKELIQLNNELETMNKELASANEKLESVNKQLAESRSEILETNDMLNESRRKLATLIENLPGIAYRCRNDREWTMEFISTGCRTITGYDSEELVGNSERSFNGIIYKEDRDMVWNHIQEAVGKSEAYEIRYRVVNRNGNIVWVWEKGRAIYGSNGEIIALEGFITDITEMIRKDEQIRQIQKMEVIGTLAGGIAHDFNNILGGIIGSADLLWKILEKQKINDSDHVLKYMTTIKNASSRASDLIKQLLILSKKNEMRFIPVDINASVRNVVSICQSSFPRSVEIRTGFYYKPAVVMADPTHVEQVILNLCVNSSHAMTIMRSNGEVEGGILQLKVDSVQATPELCRRNPDAREGFSYFVIDISDTGIGMDSDAVARIFEPFFSTKKEGEGSGLGMSIVLSIIKQYDGFIEVYSEKGKGTSIKVYIPLLSSKEYFKDKEAVVDKVEHGTGLILVVDDEEIMRTITEEALRERGYRVIPAKDGLAAIEIFMRDFNGIDLVLLDMSMPGISGKDVFNELKKISPSVKVIFSSGYSSEEKVKEMLDLGAVAFMQKPYKIDQLIQKVRDSIGK